MQQLIKSLKDITNLFLEENYIKEPIKAKDYLGLFYKNELVQIIDFSGDKLLLSCSKKYVRVLNGLSKLIKHSKRTKFIAYIDRVIFNEEDYLDSGFKLIEKNPHQNVSM